VTIPVEALRGLARASRLLERACDELSLAQYRVLSSVASGDERASRIADRLALGKPAISATVDSLAQRGLLRRANVETDQRAAALALTAEGRATLARVEAAMAERVGTLAAHTDDPAATLTALAALDDAVDRYLVEHTMTGGQRQAAERR
jgi:DNA-binding MarR family transcriptional regulator